jgi:predicted membrane protein
MRKALTLSMVFALFFSGCAMFSTANFGKHKVYANEFTEWSENMADDLNELHAKADDPGKEWLETKVNPIYSDALDNIEAYTELLRVWQVTETKPLDIDDLYAKIQTAVLRIAELLVQYKK